MRLHPILRKHQKSLRVLRKFAKFSFYLTVLHVYYCCFFWTSMESCFNYQLARNVSGSENISSTWIKRGKERFLPGRYPSGTESALLTTGDSTTLNPFSLNPCLEEKKKCRLCSFLVFQFLFNFSTQPPRPEMSDLMTLHQMRTHSFKNQNSSRRLHRTSYAGYRLSVYV